MATEIKLTVEFINKVMVGRKIVRETLSGNRYCYYGLTKKECIEKAKKAFRYNSSYKKEFTTEIVED